MTATIDLNSDVGEGYVDDAAMLDLVTSANVACGFHAGDAETMARTVRAATDRGVRVGAQVSYDDREGFGRRRMDVATDDLIAGVLVQMETLATFCQAAGTRLAYLKPHGALYNRILDDEQQASAVVEAMTTYGENLPLLTLPDSVAARIAVSAGITVISEGFADRGYTNARRLIPRDEPGALLHDPDAVAAHALDLARNSDVQSLCVHGDTPGAVSLARAARQALEDAGLRIQAFA
jgi:UPF0271 protein